MSARVALNTPEEFELGAEAPFGTLSRALIAAVTSPAAAVCPNPLN